MTMRNARLVRTIALAVAGVSVPHIPAPLHAQPAPASAAAAAPAGLSPARATTMLVNVAAFDALRTQPGVVVLQVGSAQQYEAAHVPGARFVALSDISTPRTPGSLTLELPDTPTLEKWARAVGHCATARASSSCRRAMSSSRARACSSRSRTWDWTTGPRCSTAGCSRGRRRASRWRPARPRRWRRPRPRSPCDATRRSLP